MKDNSQIILDRVPITTPRIPFPRDSLEKSVIDRFGFIVEMVPESIAVNDFGQEYTYQELNSRANCLAHEIIKLNGRSGDQKHAIALVLGHGVDIIIGMLGVLKAGCFFTSIDTSLPKNRVSYLIDDSRAKVIITNGSYLKVVEDLKYKIDHVINLDNLNWKLNINEVDFRGNNDDISNLTYTSGSTGKPKGVIRKHYNLLHSGWWTGEIYSVSPDDRFSIVSSFSQGGAVHTVFRALFNGATLYPYNLKYHGFKNLIPWIETNRITIFLSTPTVLRQMSLFLQGPNCFNSMRIYMLGGETIRRSDIHVFNDHFSEKTILRLGGGTTEASVFAVCFLQRNSPIPDLGVPMGFIIPDTDVLIWDEKEELLPNGELGEIVVKSHFISSGFWRQLDLTQRFFRSDPVDRHVRYYKTGDLGILTSDGLLFHKGRKDQQVKIRGFRVELGEVKSTLIGHNGISEAVVTGQPDKSNGTILVSYVKSSDEKEEKIRVSDLRRYLAERLPDYMIPKFFIILDKFPRTTSGKIKYSELPIVDPKRPQLDTPYFAPRNSLEKKVANIWSDILGVESVGVFDEFFELGGHSLLITQIINKIQVEFGVDIKIRQFFEASTISELAQVIKSNT